MAGADDAAAVQVGGPSGTMIGTRQFPIAVWPFEDLATGGAVIIFSGAPNILEIVEYYLSFFVHESCGYCTPCRVGNVFLQKPSPNCARAMPTRATSKTSARFRPRSSRRAAAAWPDPLRTPCSSTLDNFPLVYAAVTRDDRATGSRPSFDIQSAIERARGIAKRRSVIFDKDYSQ